MKLLRRIEKIEAATEPTFVEAIAWVESRNPSAARVIKRETDRLKDRNEPSPEIREGMTLDEATMIYKEQLQ